MSHLSSSSHDIKRVKKGIFEVAYEQPRSLRALWTDFLSNLPLIRQRSRAAVQLLKELFLAAPIPFTLYAIAALWPGVMSAMYLWSAAFFLEVAGEFIFPSHITVASLVEIQVVVVLLVLSSFITALFKQISFESARRIKHCIRDHFYAAFARRSLALDLNTAKAPEVQSALPLPWAFEIDNSLGWEFFHGLMTILQNFFTIALEISMLLAIVATQTVFLSDLVAFCCIVVPTLMVCIPTNGLGGVGYSFWTNNPAYHRLAAMHQIIFDTEYRKTLLKDGATDFVLAEYERSMKELGFLSVDAEILCYGIPVAWYWQMLQVMVDVPLIGFLFTYPTVDQVSTTSWLMTGLFVQYAATRMKKSIDNVKTSQKPLHEVLGVAERFYKGLTVKGLLKQGRRPYPDRTHSLSMGMRISFRNVSLVHQSSLCIHPAVQNVSFNIAPGQFVLLVGQNGSGKTSLLHLISGLFEPSEGVISIDGVPAQEFNSLSLRQAMVVLLQTEEIYPLSIRDNLFMSLSELDKARCHLKSDYLDQSAEMGGSYRFINSLTEKYETVLNPVGHFNTSSDIVGNGPVSSAVVEEMRRNAPRMSSIPISGGEKQRLIASRAFMKLNNYSGVKLLVVDEATSALDAIAERNLLERFRSHSVGKTTIFVTHRFQYLAHQADLILCMHEGKLIQQGTHGRLMSDLEGEYAKLYRAQLDPEH